MTKQLPNVRLTTAKNKLGQTTSFPLSPVAGDFEVLDHNGIERPADSVRVHNAAVAAGLTHTFTSRTCKLNKAVAAAVVASGWKPLVALGSKVVRYDGRKHTAYVFGTAKA